MVLNKYLFIALGLYSVINLAQIKHFDELKNNPNYEVKLLKDSTVEVYNKQQNYRYLKTIKEFPEGNNPTEANLIIELDTVNFANYENLYKQWGNLPVYNSYGTKYIAIDANGNGKNEVYATYVYSEQSYQEDARARIYEHNLDSSFNYVYEYPTDTLGNFCNAGDITGDGLLDIFSYGTGNSLHFFRQENINSYINTPNFIYNPFPRVYQPNNPTFYDIDGDGNLEIIYFLAAGSLDSIWAGSNHIAKYNPQVNNYELIYFNRPQPEYYTNGISIGDFDQDGKGNFGTGSIGGKFYVYEYVQGTEYQVEFTIELETFNAYLTTFTDDMDGNGKPEVWIGGDFASGIYGGVTRLFAFESPSPGVYELVYQIDIRGLFSFIDGRMRYVDLNGYGQKDLFLTNANLVFGFNYDKIRQDYYMEFVKSIPLLDSANATTELLRIDVADLDGNGVVEIIPQFELYFNGANIVRYYSIFYKRDIITSIDVEEDINPNNFAIYQNYPNPFNPSTQISYSLAQDADVTLRVYDILGTQVAELVNEQQTAGSYVTNFNAKILSSGVYIYRIIASNNGRILFTDSKQMILLR